MNKIIRFSISVILLHCFFVVKLSAISAYPYSKIINQPDGSELTVRLNGDEFFHYYTTEDGYVINKNNKGFFTYARFLGDGKYKPSNQLVNDISKRTNVENKYIKNLQRNPNLNAVNQNIRKARVESTNVTFNSFPLTGSPKSLVILVNFSDLSFVTTTPQISFTNLLNQKGYSENNATGSARDYFRDASNGVFEPIFEVVGPYTLPNSLSFYGENNTSKNDKNPQQLVIDACTLAAANGVDFSKYDTDNDGFVDNIFVYYAGYNEAEHGPDNTIWPHRWALPNLSTKFNGKIVYDYACTSELRGNSGKNMCGIGTFSHEFGHVLGIPDYYPTNEATHHSPSFYSIMDSGAYLNNGNTPPTYSAYDRFYLNWLKPVELLEPQFQKLDDLITSNTAFLITEKGNHNLVGNNPNPVEFFMLENRQKSGWDTYLPGHGLLISHIYYNPTTWNNNTVNNVANSIGYDIIEADGLASDNNLLGDLFPGTLNVTSYKPMLRSGMIINKPITEIQESGKQIKFTFKGGPFAPVLNAKSNIINFSTIQGTPSDYQTVNVWGKNIDKTLEISFNNRLNYEMKLKSDVNWSKSIVISAVDSIIESTDILVRYNPIEPSFEKFHSDSIIIRTKNADQIDFLMFGQSTRKVYVVPPLATTASDVRLGSFVANWDDVFDATVK